MRFDKALWDGSDPSYAPLASWSGKTMWWKATPKYVGLGYTPVRVRLPGAMGDGLDLERAAEARRLTLAMLGTVTKADLPVGTWAWLIHRYRTDEFSPFHEVKANTRASYVWQLDRWTEAIGKLAIGALTYERIKQIQAGMAEKGRSVSYIKRLFTTLRIVARYGKALKIPEAVAVASTLAEVRFKSPPKRQIAPTREEIRAIVDEADAHGMFAYATGLLLQWVFALRGVDVFGQWLDDPKGEGGIRRGTKRWADGLTWDMVEPDLTAFSKVISKTANALPEPIRFSLEDAAEIRARLRLLENAGRLGPVIVSEQEELPYTIWGRSQAFRRLRTRLKLRPEITMMDTRAGALTDGGEAGADLLVLRDAAGHLDAATTNRYVRSREANIGRLVRMRNKT